MIRPEHIRAVRLGYGANCSSIGSVVDTLFVTAVAGAAVFAAVCAAMRRGDDEDAGGAGPARFEAWGAWMRIAEPAALVAIDREGARALGLDGGAVWSDDAAPRTPIEVHLAVTSRCGAGCEGCYLDARPDGIEPPRADIVAQLDALAEAKVLTVAFGGGEPTLRDDLGVLAEAARARGITPVVTTSGIGLGPRKIEALKSFAQVNVSYDGAGEDYAKVRGFDASGAAESAIVAHAAAGIAVGVNVVLTRETFPHVGRTLERAFALGAREAQLLRYKPAGRATGADYLAKRLTAEQARSLGPLLRSFGDRFGGRHVRVDCALVPFLSADPSIDVDTLARWGVFGCEAGNALASTKVDGRVAGCSFAPATDLHVTDLAAGFGSTAGLDVFRDYVAAPPEPCASCTLRSVCRGGCKIVAAHLEDAFRPDPECPRVRAYL